MTGSVQRLRETVEVMAGYAATCDMDSPMTVGDARALLAWYDARAALEAHRKQRPAPGSKHEAWDKWHDASGALEGAEAAAFAALSAVTQETR